MLSARDSVEDLVRGLDAGANDYLVKPYAFTELLARLRALQRRYAGHRELVLRVDNLELDSVSRRVTRGGDELALTSREFEILVYLLRHKNENVSRDMIALEVWKEPKAAMTNVIDVHIQALRRKIERPGWAILIHTERGVGYALRDGS